MTKLFGWDFSTCLCAFFVLVQTSITSEQQRITFDSIPSSAPWKMILIYHCQITVLWPLVPFFL
jgi:hypothetical protein